jgi:hypothetical protein
MHDERGMEVQSMLGISSVAWILILILAFLNMRERVRFQFSDLPRDATNLYTTPQEKSST